MAEDIAASFRIIAQGAREFGASLAAVNLALLEVAKAVAALMPPIWQCLGLHREPTDWVEWLWVSWSFVRERKWRYAKLAWWEAKRAFRVEVDSMC